MDRVEPPMHTTTTRTDFEPTRVIIEGQPEDWFWVMRPFVRCILPTLTLAETRFMFAVFDHRDRSTNRTEHISDRKMCDLIRMSKQAVSVARKLLLEHAQRPLALHGDGIYEPMPGRAWKQRRVSSLLDDPPPVVHHGGRLSMPVDAAEPHRAPVGSSIPIQREKIVVVDSSVEVLTKGGQGPAEHRFDARDAAGLIKRTGADIEQCRTAVRNADAKQAARGLKSSWRGYVASQLANGCSLFSGLQAEDNNAQRNRDAVVRVCGFLEADHAEHARHISAWWNDLSVSRKAKALDARDRELDNERLAGVLWQKVESEARYGRQAVRS